MGLKGGIAVFEKIKAIIVEELGIDPEDVRPESNFVDDLGADSLDIVELVMALEDAFDITVSDEQAQTLKTVGDVVAFIEKL